MESIVSYFSNLGIDLYTFLRLTATLFIGTLLFSAIHRFIFQKQTLLGHAVSSSISIVFIYVVTVLIIQVITDLRYLVSSLPFVSITQNCITFFSFHCASFPSVSAQLLSMIVLSFLVNLIDSWLPLGKNLINWLSFRCLTVIFGFLMHYLVTWLFNRYCPDFVVLYAPMILLALLVTMLLTGALRIVVGLILTTVNPVIAALYTFFFASMIGKQITKAVLTTAIISGLIIMLEKSGITTLSLMTGALVAYVPFLLLLIPVWYIVSRP